MVQTNGVVVVYVTGSPEFVTAARGISAPSDSRHSGNAGKVTVWTAGVGTAVVGVFVAVALAAAVVAVDVALAATVVAVDVAVGEATNPDGVGVAVGTTFVIV
jgi:hypothetical protein